MPLNPDITPYFHIDPWYSPDEHKAVWEEYQRRLEKVSIIIPARNEENNIADIVNYCRLYGDELIVVDGHSTDGTRKIADGLGCRVIEDHGKGKGDGLRTAAQAATGDILVFIDADYSHRPADIPRLVAPLLRGESDLVIGSRISGGSDEAMITFDHLIRLVGSQMIAFGIALIFGKQITEVENGFRAIRRDIFISLELKQNDFTIEQEMVIRALRKRYRVMEVPTHEYARRGGESKLKTIQGWKFILNFFQALWF
ncbi:MAG: glycosyltransferase family 2 protein [PVC group bacterium]